MGEYWKPVNFTKKEYIEPHTLNCGLKFSEWVNPYSAVYRRIEELISLGKWDASDDIAAVSDYGGLFQLRGVPGERIDEPYMRSDDHYRNVSLPDGYK